MNPGSLHDLAEGARLHAMFEEAAARARALAYALAHVHGLREEEEIADFVRAALAPYAGPPPTPPMRRSAPPAETAAATPADERSTQDVVIDILRDVEGELTIAQLLNVMDDAGHPATQNHLSVILTRLSQSGVIERAGRGRYRARR
ncbi:MAG: hypothetical protein JNK46_10545 [Methylobacteriaceae bacterium]|nr:hypothetical protein [Methylobacteriaceae bacterium]